MSIDLCPVTIGIGNNFSSYLHFFTQKLSSIKYLYGKKLYLCHPAALSGTMYDFPDSTDIFEIFEVMLANYHILGENHLATTNLAILE